MQFTELGRERQRRCFEGSDCGFATVAAGVTQRRRWPHQEQNNRRRHPQSLVALSTAFSSPIFPTMTGRASRIGHRSASEFLSRFSSGMSELVVAGDQGDVSPFFSEVPPSARMEDVGVLFSAEQRCDIQGDGSKCRGMAAGNHQKCRCCRRRRPIHGTRVAVLSRTVNSALAVEEFVGGKQEAICAKQGRYEEQERLWVLGAERKKPFGSDGGEKCYNITFNTVEESDVTTVTDWDTSRHTATKDKMISITESGQSKNKNQPKKSGWLHIVGEVRLLVNHCLLGLPGVRKEELKRVLSHPQVSADNTVGAAQDNSDNVTRFLILAREPMIPRTDRLHKGGHRFFFRSSPFSGEQKAARQRPPLQFTELGRERQRRCFEGSGCGFATVAAGVTQRRRWRHHEQNNRRRHPQSLVALSTAFSSPIFPTTTGRASRIGHRSASEFLSRFSSGMSELVVAGDQGDVSPFFSEVPPSARMEDVGVLFPAEQRCDIQGDGSKCRGTAAGK
nr:arogenate dehydratase/prephenate dehydratase 1, chloroplastic [Ipomoea batatas]